MGEKAADDGSFDAVIALAAAHYHPDAGLRGCLLARCQAPECNGQALPSREAIERCLEAERGTEVEPFWLSGGQRQLAVNAVRLAFLDPGCEAVRVVSGRTVGVCGGLVVGRDLSSTWLPRRGYTDEAHDGCPFVAPAAFEDCLRTLQGRKASPDRHLSIECRTTCHGIELVIETAALAALLDLEGPDMYSRLQAHSSVGPRGVPFSEAGLRVVGGHRTTKIKTGSAEALLRFSSCMATGAWISLAVAPDGWWPFPIMSVLRSPDDDRFSIRGAPIVPPAHATCWTTVALPPVAPLPRADRVAIARWIGVPSPWLCSEILGDLQ